MSCMCGVWLSQPVKLWARILVQVTINRRLRIGRDEHLDQSDIIVINRRLRIGRDEHLDQSEAYDIS